MSAICTLLCTVTMVTSTNECYLYFALYGYHGNQYQKLKLLTQVTAVEFLDNIGGLGIDLEIAKTLQRSLTKQGTNTVFDLCTLCTLTYRHLVIEKYAFQNTHFPPEIAKLIINWHQQY